MDIRYQGHASVEAGDRMESQLRTIAADVSSAGWQSVSPLDEGLYAKRLEACDVAHSYENSWAYLFQQARVAAFKYVGDGMLLTAIVKDAGSPFVFVLPPIGVKEVIDKQLPDAVRRLAVASRKRVVLRKISAEDESGFSALGFRRVEPTQFTLASDFPEDAYPQVVLKTDICERLSHESIFQKIRGHMAFLRRTRRISYGSFSELPVADLRRIVGRWAEAHNASIRGTEKETSGFADPAAYLCLVDEFGTRIDGVRFFGQVIFLDDEPAGLAFAGRTGSTSAALYASICIQGIRGASECQMIQLLGLLARAGVLSLNLGGAETDGLFAYKQKYGALCLMPKIDLEFDDMDSGDGRPP